MNVFNPKDVYIVQRNATSSSFEEQVLSSAPNSLFFFDSASKVVALLSSSISAGTAIFATSASYATTSSYALNVPTTASYTISSSHAVQADTASLVKFPGVVDNYFPQWENGTLSKTSSISIAEGDLVNINNVDIYSLPDPPTLAVKQVSPTSTITVHVEADVDNYSVVSIQNKGSGSFSSADYIAAGDVGYSNNNFIDMGIGSSTYNDSAFSITTGSDGYVYVSSGSLAIGTSDAGYVTKFFAGGTTANKEVARVTEAGLLMTGSIQLSNGGVISAFTESAAPIQKAGTMWWDKVNHTFAIDAYESRLQIGQENYVRVVAGEPIPNGSATYFHLTAADPENPTYTLPVAYLAIADSTGLKSAVTGLSTQTLAISQSGFITTQGIINDINTSGSTAGQILYLSNTTPGTWITTLPLHPAEVVIVGTVIVADSTIGRILVNVITIPPVYTFVGPIVAPTISTTGSIVNIGSIGIHFCTTTDGLGPVEYFTIPSSSFTLSSSFLDVQYVVANYNSGSPEYQLYTDLSLTDDIQIVPIATLTLGTAGNISYIDWDSSGILLANKQNQRIIELWGAQRASGLNISTSGSHILLTAGTGYLGVKELTFTTASTETAGQFVLLSHSASVWSGSLINGWINDRYDDGADLQPLGVSKFVVNYVFRGIGSLNRAQVMLST